MIKFLSFLGTNAYTLCNYFYKDYKIIDSCCYIQEALLTMLKERGIAPDEVIVFTTQKSYEENWIKNKNVESGKPGLKETLENIKLYQDENVGDINKIKNIMIPEGNSEKELWDIFNIIYNSIDENDELIFDITHSFRFMPMLAFLVLNYARAVKNCRINAVYYGGFEVLGVKSVVENMPMEKRNAPVFDLTQFINVFDWTIGVDRYLNTGDASIINDLTISGVNFINMNIKEGSDSGDFKTTGLLKRLATILQSYSDMVFTCRGKQLSSTANELKKIIEEVMDKCAQEYIKPLVPIMEKLYERFKIFGQDEYKDLLEIVKWCRDNKLYQQGLTILEEGLIGYICDIFGLDKKSLDDRRLAGQCIAIKFKGLPKEEWEKPDCENQRLVEDIISSDKINKDLMNLIRNIQDKRNDINHAGWRDNPGRPQTLKKNLDDYIKRSEDIIFNTPVQLVSEDEMGPKVKNMLLLFSHHLTNEQEKDARENLGVGEFISLPPELQQKWSNIPPELESLREYLKDIFEWIDKVAGKGDFVLVEGEFGATYSVVSYCIDKDLIPIYSTTERKVIEEAANDGVKTQRVFKHVRFRQY